MTQPRSSLAFTCLVLGILTLPLLAACSTMRGHGSEDDDAAEDAAEIASLNAAHSLFFSAWSKREGQPFDATNLRRVITGNPDFLSFDAMSENKTILDGPAQYLATWEPGMNQFTTARLSEARHIRTWCEDDLGVTCCIARIQGTMPGGQTLDMPGHLTLVWTRSAGTWRVVHEHMSLGVKE